MQKAQEQARKQSEMNQFIKAQLASTEIEENPDDYDEVENQKQIQMLKEQNKELKQNLNHVKSLYKKSISKGKQEKSEEKPQSETLIQTQVKKQSASKVELSKALESKLKKI